MSEDRTKTTDPGETTLTGEDSIHVDEMYQDWFLDYASYVILDRAVPYLEDGLKPVQRRILHAMKILDDGRYHKVANIIGKTMTFHPHGDASIGDALVNMGQKDLLIDTQGNWGNVLTGDPAAAPRYIEARLSKFALEILFHNELTAWQASYDGRAKEPVMLPVRFPLLLAQGVEGIAVGLSTKILPHNFCELIKASIAILEGRRYKLLPDFPTGGTIDVSDYNKGARGGRVKVRAKIDVDDAKTLRITEVPFGTTTSSLMDSIVAANEKGKIKIRKIEDNTARNVEILVHLPSGVSPDVTVDALYAFTDCEVSISPNCCIIYDGKPLFTDVHTLLETSTENTKMLIQRQLEIKLSELEEKWHFSSLEKIFIEKRIYRDIEECETWDAVIAAIDAGLKPYKKKFKREIVRDDIVRLTEIKIKRISKYDGFKADELIKDLEKEIAQVKLNLAHLTEYVVAYFEDLLARYGKGRERKTELKEFTTVAASQVAAATHKLYVDRVEGFVGTALKKNELLGECSSLDEVIAIREDGKMMVSKVGEKMFMGKDIMHIAIYKRGDERTIYNMIYRDGRQGISMVKRFSIPAITRDREYDLTRGTAGTKVHYLSANPQGEAETVRVNLSDACKARKKQFEFDFGTLEIKGRDTKGNQLTEWPIKKVTRLSVGPSTLAPEKIWYDEASRRLNTQERGRFLGEFGGDDKVIAVYNNGSYEVTDFNPDNIYGDGVTILAKLPSPAVLAVVYKHGERQEHYVKRFDIPAEITGRRVDFLNSPGSELSAASFDSEAKISVEYKKAKTRTPEPQTIKLADFIEVKGMAALGNKLSKYDAKKIVLSEKPTAPATVKKGQSTLPLD